MGSNPNIKSILRDFIKLRDALLSLMLKKIKKKEGIKVRGTKYNLLEKLLWSDDSDVQLLTAKEEVVLFENFTKRLFHLVDYFLPVADKVVAHYMKAIVYSGIQASEIRRDLEMEAIIGVIKGLLRLKRKIVVSPDADLVKIESYVMKVARTHIKDVISNFVLMTHIPRTCWSKIGEDKSKYAPIYFSEIEENNKNTDTTPSEPNNGEDLETMRLVERFDMFGVEFRDYLMKLPEPFRSALLCKLEGEEAPLPSFILNALAKYAIDVFCKI